MVKVLVLLSGGLDSRLACKILQEQLGRNAEALFFILPFAGGCCSDKFCVFRFCQKEKIRLHIIDLTKGKLFKEYMQIIRKPKYQRGVSLNPCIDCHVFMLKKAKQLAKKLEKENKTEYIIATGEVLNERPLSQNKKALMLINKELGFPILRPLSAKLLPETKYEKLGKIDRNKLLDIQGRQRKRQIELARKFSIDFPHPAGGCLLCEKEYCKKLELILNKKINYNDIKLLSIGRHFLASQIILGRNKEENDLLEKEPGIKIIPKQPAGTALIKNKNKKLIEKAKLLIKKYSKHKVVEFEIKN